MSADTLTQILGLIGTITGALALLISYRTYTNARPNLKVKVKKIEHYSDSFIEEKNMTIATRLAISNCGDRPTTLNEIEAQFTQEGKQYKFKEEFLRTVTDGEENIGYSKISVEPHETTDEYVYLKGLVSIIPQEIICNFRIYHTHGICSFRATSSKR
jgi:hypothetical protein